MRRAIALSSRAGLEFAPGGAFGALIIKDGHIIAEGMNRVVACRDPTWHAEMKAILLASLALQSFKLTGCTLYTSAEPCPMCLAASYWAGIERIYFAATVEDAWEYGGFDDRFVYQELALSPEQRCIPMTGLLRQEAVAVWEQYQAKPYKVPY
ncbi:MAG TPA: nucleoside deaminase [Chromatiaceae bacterium]|nr:nucleoside deaminase [Chromatiaceae bacterium]